MPKKRGAKTHDIDGNGFYLLFLFVVNFDEDEKSENNIDATDTVLYECFGIKLMQKQ